MPFAIQHNYRFGQAASTKQEKTRNDLNPLAVFKWPRSSGPIARSPASAGLSSAKRPWFTRNPKERQRFFDFELPSIGLGSGMCRSARFWAYFGRSWTKVARGNGPRRGDRRGDAEV